LAQLKFIKQFVIFFCFCKKNKIKQQKSKKQNKNQVFVQGFQLGELPPPRFFPVNFLEIIFLRVFLWENAFL